jgi:peroxiredoxin Q/BCP
MLAGAVVAATSRAFAALAVGDDAPDFTLPGTDGKDAKLSSFRGKKNVVLAFFPKAFTGG